MITTQSPVSDILSSDRNKRYSKGNGGKGRGWGVVEREDPAPPAPTSSAFILGTGIEWSLPQQQGNGAVSASNRFCNPSLFLFYSHS